MTDKQKYYRLESDAIYSDKKCTIFSESVHRSEREFFKNVGKFLPHDTALHPEEQFC
jgi:hypothetical protein